MTERELIRRLWQALVDAHGGPEVERMLIDHHIHRRSLDQIACEYGIPRSTVHRRVQRMRSALDEAGVLPEQSDISVPHFRDIA